MIGTMTGPPAFTISNMVPLDERALLSGANTSSFAPDAS